jgi:xylulokinase
MAIGGLDIGSTGAKLTVVDERGTLLHTGYQDYQVSRIAGTHEIDAIEIWNTVKKLLRDASSVVHGFEAVGIISFGESFVLVSDHDEIQFPTMMYTDPRGEEQAADLAARLGEGIITGITGTMPHPMFTLPKLMWVKRNRPDIYAKTKYIFLIGDFIVYMLTGERIIDYSLASRTMGFDIRKKKWDETIFDAAEIDIDLFSKPVPSGTPAGIIRSTLAADLGLPDNFYIVICAHDQVAATIGSHVLRPGMAANGAGTVECITPVFTSIPDNNALQKANFSVVPFPENRYCCYAFCFSGGSLIKWFINQCASGQISQVKAKDGNIYEFLENAAPDRPTGILLLPHFAGAATPYMDTGSKGAIIGLELSHTTADIFRAVMEGISYEMMLNIERLAEVGISIKSLYVSGGCARSVVWLQMKADLYNIPVTRLSIDEAGTLGGILLTGKAMGAFESLEQGVEFLVKPLRTYAPRPEMHEQYMRHYERYRKLYDAVRRLV